ncbi:MAG: hypothetical protein AAGF11_11335 [Myxococcota bacterium]
MTTPSIDPLRYLTCPRLSVASGLSLGRMLLTAAPDDPPPNVRAAARSLDTAVEVLAARWVAKTQRHSAQSAWPYDHRLRRAWSTVHRCLGRYRGAYEHPDHARAVALYQRLFPTGLDFIDQPHPERHAQSNRRVELVIAEGLRDELDHLVGEMFVDDLLDAHRAYGAALGVNETTGQIPPISLAAALRALTRAISGYALQVVAFAALDPDNVVVARRALWPIDVVRRASARRSASRRGNSTVRVDGAA